MDAPRCFRCWLLLLSCLLLLGQVPALAAPTPADTTRWLDFDTSPWLRGIRRWPPAHERSIAFWQAQTHIFPRPDTVRVVLLDRLAAALVTREPPAAYPVHLAALRLAQALPYPQIRAEMQLALADYHARLVHYDSAAYYLREAEEQFRLDRNLGGVVRCLNRLGGIAEQQGRYAASLGYYYQSLALATTGNSRRFRTSTKIQLATLYTQVGDYAEARRYLNDALRVARQWDYPDRINLALGELGEVSRRQRQWSQARSYFERSLAVSRQVDDLPYALAMQLSLARLQADQGQYPAAAAEGRQVLARLRAANLPLLLPQAQALLARVALAQGQAPAAVAYARQSLAGGQQTHQPQAVAEASAVLADAYARQHLFEPALAAHRLYEAAHDSLLGDVARRRTAVLQVGQQQREQQARIRLLTQQNRFQAQAQELSHLRAQRVIGALGVLLLLALLLAGATLWGVRRRQARREARLRNQLAADLHDDVGTLLSQISLQSELLQSGLADPAGQVRKLGQIAEASRAARRQLNDVVWSLDAHNDLLPSLLDRLRDYAYEVLTAAGLPVEFEVPPELPAQPLTLELRRQLYLLYKEALANVLRHAPAARWVRVHLAPQGGGLLLNVSNDVWPAPDGPARRSGHGLRNISERAAALHGQAEYGPLPGGGFGVRVWVPLAG